MLEGVREQALPLQLITKLTRDLRDARMPNRLGAFDEGDVNTVPTVSALRLTDQPSGSGEKSLSFVSFSRSHADRRNDARNPEPPSATMSSKPVRFRSSVGDRVQLDPLENLPDHAAS